MTKLTLENDYIEQERPYSQRELQFNREKLFRLLHIGDIRAIHTKCNHFYYVKDKGRKERDIKEKKTNVDVGNCSVCWRLNTTLQHLKDKARYITDAYMSRFFVIPNYLEYNDIELESLFYNWLYEEIV